VWWPAGDQRIVDGSHCFAKSFVVTCKASGYPGNQLDSLFQLRIEKLVNKYNRKKVDEFFMILM
jgi:hypothetical protein